MKKMAIMILVFSFIMLMVCSKDDGTKQQHPIANLKEFIVIGHRGASAYSPEHTIEAYELAKRQAADYIEIDLQMTKDDVLVAMHDSNVDRTTNGSGPVRSYTLQELKKLDAGTWFNIENPGYADPTYEGITVPTLEEIVGRFGTSVNYYIEIKDPASNPEIERKLIQLLAKYDLLDSSDLKNGKVIIQSFSEKALRYVHRLNKDIPLIQLLQYEDSTKITTMKLKKWKEYAVGVGVDYDIVDKKVIKKVKAADLLIHVYTVNQEVDMKRLVNLGINGAFTNISGRLIQVFKMEKEKKNNRY